MFRHLKEDNKMIKTLEQLHQLFTEKSTFKRYPKNTILLKEGAIANKMIYIKSGVVRHFFRDRDGNEITKNFIQAPNFFLYSLSSFITQTPTTVLCEALTDVELYELPREEYEQMMQNKKFIQLWNQMLTNYILKKEKKEMAVMQDKAITRYNQFLKDFPGLLNQIPHYYIASYLAISPETLSRIRKKIS